MTPGALHLVTARSVPRLWTPGDGPSGMLLLVRTRPLAAVIGGRIVEAGTGGSEPTGSGRPRIEGGLILMGTLRKKEPQHVVGHPDLASGASVQRGDTLYVSIAEAVYRESRGEEVELHFVPTPEDEEALGDLKIRARNRWENDRLPDGWTRPVPPVPTPKTEEVGGQLTPDLRTLAEAIRARYETFDDEASAE